MQYDRTLREDQVERDPITQFRAWFGEALTAELFDPHAMTLATATRDGQPSARMVLLKGVDEHGFTFYTNYESRKGCELAENPRAALVFYWPRLERQVRIEGTVERLSRDESGRYFHSRPRGSQLGAWASRQSQVLSGRAVLDEKLAEVTARYEGQDVPLPPYWGGFRVVPRRIEFWQSGRNRLHDRLRYMRQDDGTWRIERLSP